MPDDIDLFNRTLASLAASQGGVRRLFVRDLVVDARIGVYDFEKQGPQKVRIDVDLYLEDPANPTSDRLGDVLDYGYIWSGVHEIVKQGHINLQETLVERIMAHCLRPDCVIAARVSSSKPDAYDDCGGVGYEVFRMRQRG